MYTDQFDRLYLAISEAQVLPGCLNPIPESRRACARNMLGWPRGPWEWASQTLKPKWNPEAEYGMQDTLFSKAPTSRAFTLIPSSLRFRVVGFH